MKLIITKEKVKFLDIMIGNVFYYGDRFWIRINHNTASELKGTGWLDGRVGNFNLPEMKDELMTKVEVEKAS